MARFETNLRDRWIEKPEERVPIDFTGLDEDKIYYWVKNHPYVEKVNDYKLPPTDDRFWKEWGYGDRYFICPDGTLFFIDATFKNLSHWALETEAAQEGLIPPVVLDKIKYTTPVFEELGWIKIMRENAIILPQGKITNLQKYAVEDWINKFGETRPFYSVVFPSGEILHIEPSDYDDFKTATYALGQIKLFYESWPVTENQKRLQKIRQTKIQGENKINERLD